MRIHCLALAALLFTSAIPAHAAYTTIDYTGYVSRIYVPGSGTEADIVVNAPVLFSITVDLARTVSFGTFTLPNGATGAPMVVHSVGVSLYQDSLASYTITLGSHTWTQADETIDDTGYFTPSGVGPNPLLAYDGSPSQLIGLSSDAINAEGLDLYSDPADYFLQDARYPVYGGSTGDGVQFAVAFDAPLNDQILALRAAALTAGQVPEPSSQALLLLGGIALWRVSRRRVTPACVPIGQFA